jgi:hypothetical protein
VDTKNISSEKIYDDFPGRRFTKFKEVSGISKFHEVFIDHVLLWYSNNGWNTPTLGKIFDGVSKDEQSSLKDNLPNSSLNFEKKSRSLLEKILKNDEYFGDLDICERSTRKWFFTNQCCSKNGCSFIKKYKVTYNKRFNKFTYTIGCKGKHENLIIGKSRKSKISMIATCVLNDNLGAPRSQIINVMNKSINLKKNKYNRDLMVFPTGKIKNKKYYKRYSKNGNYLNSFIKLSKLFEDRSFKYLKLIHVDEKELELIFLVWDKEIYPRKIIFIPGRNL